MASEGISMTSAGAVFVGQAPGGGLVCRGWKQWAKAA